MIPAIRLEDNGVPLYVQIREQMLRGIAAGALRPGERMPTMREVAVSLKVDLNTVRHAYDDLEQAGAIIIQRARGTFVAERPPHLDADKQAGRLEVFARQVMDMADVAGLAAEDVAESIRQLAKNPRAKN